MVLAGLVAGEPVSGLVASEPNLVEVIGQPAAAADEVGPAEAAGGGDDAFPVAEGGADGLVDGGDVEVHGPVSGAEDDGEGAGASDLAGGPDDGGGVFEAEFGDAGQPFLEGDAELEAGEVGAEAAVDAETEGDVAVLRAVEDDPVGVGERQEDLVPGLKDVAVEFDFFDDEAGHGDGGVGPEEFFGGGGEEPGMLDEPVAVVGMTGEMPEAGADGAPSGVDPGEEQDPQRAEDVRFAELLAAELGGEERADQVVVAGTAVGGDGGAEVLLDLDHGGVPGPGVAGGDLEEHVEPVAEQVAVGGGDAEEVGDDPDGDVLGVLGGGVGASFGADGVEQLGADVAGDRLEGGDRLGGEGRSEQAADRAVLRRVGGDRR